MAKYNKKMKKNGYNGMISQPKNNTANMPQESFIKMYESYDGYAMGDSRINESENVIKKQMEADAKQLKKASKGPFPRKY